MVCPRCQNQVADGIKFCPSCGSPMPTGQTPPQQPQNPYGAPPPQGQYGTPPPQGAYIPPNQYEEYANSMFGNAVPKA